MLKKSVLILTVLTVVTAIGVAGETEKKEHAGCCGAHHATAEKVETNQANCPIMGKAINRDANTNLTNRSDAGEELEKAPCGDDCQGDCCKNKSATKSSGCKSGGGCGGCGSGSKTTNT